MKHRPLNFDFSVSIMPSISHAGQHTVSILNGDKESVILGFTNDVDGVKEAFSRLFSSGEWSVDSDMNVHVMELQVSSVDSPVQSA